MVTPEEIGAIPIFAGLEPAQCERISRAAADITLAAGRIRGARRRRARAVCRARGPHRAGQGRGRRRRASWASAARATSSERCRSCSGRCSPSASERPSARASCGSSHATITRSRPTCPSVAVEVGRLAAHRMGGPRGLQGIAADAAPTASDRSRAPLGRGLRGSAALPRAQPGHLQVAHARRTGSGGGLGRAAAVRRQTARDPPRQRQDGRPSAGPSRRRAARPRHRAGRSGVRRSGRRRRARGPSGRGLRRVRGPAHDRGRAARRRAARPGPPHASRTTSASPRACPATSWRAARCSRRAGSAPRSS